MLTMSVSVRLPSDQAALARTLGERSSRTVRMALAVSATNITSWESEEKKKKKSARWRARAVLTAEWRAFWLEWSGGRFQCRKSHIIPLWDRGRERRHQEPSLLPPSPRSSRYTSAQAILWYTEPESCPSENRYTWGNAHWAKSFPLQQLECILLQSNSQTFVLRKKVKITF